MSALVEHPSHRSALRDRLLAAVLAGDAASNTGDGMVVGAPPTGFQRRPICPNTTMCADRQLRGRR
jgi:hypothetical protein